MFGGQVLSRRIQKNFKILNQGGTAFYRFENITNVPDFREFYLDRLNAIRVSDKEKDEIIQASRRVFELNIGIFEEFGEELDDEDVPSIKPKKAVSSSSKLAMKRRGASPGLVESAIPATESAYSAESRKVYYRNIIAITVWLGLATYYFVSEGYLSFKKSQ
ncbi:Heme oxygenase 2 [Entomophthora muscae]|uniref:Heme oxygenase 2 n=1 Tax=Entomophthora muscae TaxID=34485 RepID=A0ACC2SP66_9FUNG|nr:Heme oxygenase 2 [Entomophthora muscae]